MGLFVVCGKCPKKENVTLHRFPRDERLCQEWVKIIGREGWRPTLYSLLCSDHFTEDSFTFHNRRMQKRLLPGLLPTSFPIYQVEPQMEMLDTNSCYIQTVGQECNESSTNKENILDTENLHGVACNVQDVYRDCYEESEDSLLQYCHEFRSNLEGSLNDECCKTSRSRKDNVHDVRQPLLLIENVLVIIKELYIAPQALRNTNAYYEL